MTFLASVFHTFVTNWTSTARTGQLSCPAVETYVVRVWLPDEPGALGRVASQIGEIGGDVVGIEILERGAGQAVDELTVALPAGASLDGLLAQIASVPGVAIEDVRAVVGDRPDVAIVSLEVAARLVELEPCKRIDGLAHEVLELFEASWASVIDADTGTALVELGSGPESAWLAAFVLGSRHLEPEDRSSAIPADLAWARIDSRNQVITVGRAAPFRARERRQMVTLARIASGLLVGPPA